MRHIATVSNHMQNKKSYHTEDADKSRLESTRQRAGQWCPQDIQQHAGAGVVGTRRQVEVTKPLMAV